MMGTSVQFIYTRNLYIKVQVCDLVSETLLDLDFVWQLILRNPSCAAQEPLARLGVSKPIVELWRPCLSSGPAVFLIQERFKQCCDFQQQFVITDSMLLEKTAISYVIICVADASPDSIHQNCHLMGSTRITMAVYHVPAFTLFGKMVATSCGIAPHVTQSDLAYLPARLIWIMHEC